MTNTLTEHKRSTSRKPLPRGKSSSNSKTASANGYGTTARAPHDSPATIRPLQQSASAHLRWLAPHAAGHGARTSARPRPGAPPKKRGLARPAKRQHAPRPRRRSGEDLDHGGFRDGTAPYGACEKADACRAQSPRRAMGCCISPALSARQALRRHQGPLHEWQSPACHGAHCDRQLRRRDCLAPFVRVSAGFRHSF